MSSPTLECEGEGSYWTMDSDLYSELHLSESDSEGEVVLSPQQSPRKPKFLVLRSGNLVRRVRVGFQEQIDRVKRKKNYERILAIIRQRVSKKGEEPSAVISPEDLEFQGLSEEEKERQRALWQEELAKVEEEIETLRNVLKSKIQSAQKLKKKLGFTIWRELSDDFSQSVRNVKETTVYQSVSQSLTNIGKAVSESPVYQNVGGTISHVGKVVTENQVYQNVEEKITHVGKVVAENPVYQKTESVVKGAAESTRTIIGGLTGGFTHKLGQIKNSESFRSLEDKVGNAYENVKTRVSSRSSSLQSFDEALREDSSNRSSIPEGKPLS